MDAADTIAIMAKLDRILDLLENHHKKMYGFQAHDMQEYSAVNRDYIRGVDDARRECH